MRIHHRTHTIFSLDCCLLQSIIFGSRITPTGQIHVYLRQADNTDGTDSRGSFRCGQHGFGQIHSDPRHADDTDYPDLLV